jgi:hypothetical protein
MNYLDIIAPAIAIIAVSCYISQIITRLKHQLSTITAQRDRLAEALRYCREDSAELLGERDWWQSEPRCDYAKRWQETHDNLTRADEALQSLTLNA